MNNNLSALAFNAGSEARLRGESRMSNPFIATNKEEKYMWRWGWDDVDRHFGLDAQWIVRELPPVQRYKPPAPVVNCDLLGPIGSIGSIGPIGPLFVL